MIIDSRFSTQAQMAERMLTKDIQAVKKDPKLNREQRKAEIRRIKRDALISG